MKMVGRLIYGDGASSMYRAFAKGEGDMQGLAHTIIAGAALGYLSLSIKDLLKGRTLKDPASLDTILASLLQGGGLGIFGDFLFAEYNRYGRGLLDTAAGPFLGEVQSFADLYARLIRGDDFAAQLWRTVLANTPFANLFYTRAGMDYLLNYHVMEALNPGSVSRMERRLRNRTGQEFLVSPSEVVE